MHICQREKYYFHLPYRNQKMTITTHHINDKKIAEIVSDQVLIHNPEDGLQILVDIYYQDFDQMILYNHHFTPNFFDLKTKLAGEILQKYSNYKMKLAIVGDFNVWNSTSLDQFILESNKGRLVCFVPTVEEALRRLSA